MTEESKHAWPRRALVAAALTVGLVGAGYGVSMAATPSPAPSGGSAPGSTSAPAPAHHCPNR